MSVFCLSRLLMMRGAICHFPSERLQLQSAAAAHAAPRFFTRPGQCNGPVTAIDGLFTQTGGGAEGGRLGRDSVWVGLICSQIHSQTCLFQSAAGCVLGFFVASASVGGGGAHPSAATLALVLSPEVNRSPKLNLGVLSVCLSTDNEPQGS